MNELHESVLLFFFIVYNIPYRIHIFTIKMMMMFYDHEKILLNEKLHGMNVGTHAIVTYLHFLLRVLKDRSNY